MPKNGKRDDPRIAGQTRRHTRVSLEAGRIASRYLARRALGRDGGSDKGAKDLVDALGELKGPVMKIAQMLSLVPGVLPPKYQERLANLQADAPSMGWLFVRRRMRSELGDDWQKHFESFEREAAHAASIGQVHRTRARGQELACKLQYPDMTSVVKADLRQLRLFLNLYRRVDKAIKTDKIYEEMEARLDEELDYVHEAQNMRAYRHMLSPTDGIHIPEPVEDLSTNSLLTMTWLDGMRLRDTEKMGQKFRNKAASRLFSAWYIPFYRHGIIHGDPHPGNYSVTEDGIINLLDFGCVRVFPPTFVEAVLNLYKAKRDGDPELAVEAYRGWGFEHLSKEMLATLNLWADYLYAPILEDRVRPLKAEHSMIEGRKLVGKVYKEVRRLGGIQPPREFVLLDRASVGLGFVFTSIKAEINWHRVIEGIVDGFDVKSLAREQTKVLKAVGLPPPF